MHRDQALPGAVATAVLNPGIDSLERRAVAAAAADGRAILALAPGSWYLSAAADGGRLVGWYGSNPVQVRPGESLEVAIPAAPAPAAPEARTVPPGEETIRGEAAREDAVLAGAIVALYLDASTQFRGPAYIEVETDERGAFEARVSPGRYWLVVRRRSSTRAYGPLEAGDDFGYYPGNPLTVRSGEDLFVRIPAVRVLKKSGWSAPSTLRTRLRGTVRDAAGRPLAGYRAFLHAKPTMLGKPEFVSEPSGPDGSYVIWVDREGVFYLGARGRIGRSREEGEAVGLFPGSADHAVRVRLDRPEPPPLDIVVDAGEDGP